jgi:hypothetical protein
MMAMDFGLKGEFAAPAVSQSLPVACPDASAYRMTSAAEPGQQLNQWKEQMPLCMSLRGKSQFPQQEFTTSRSAARIRRMCRVSRNDRSFSCIPTSLTQETVLQKGHAL